MADMTMTQIISSIVEVGLVPVLLVIFVGYFIKRDERRDEEVKAERKNAQEQIDRINEQLKARENMLMVESAKREELIRHEATEREKLIRQETDKRENALMYNMSEMTQTMSKISDSMSDIKQTIQQMQQSLMTVREEVKKLKYEAKKGAVG